MNLCTVTGDTMQLIHETNHRLNVLDYMTGVYLAETAGSKGIRVGVQIVNNIDAFDVIAIHADGSGNFVSSTTQIQDTLHKPIFYKTVELLFFLHELAKALIHMLNMLDQPVTQ